LSEAAPHNVFLTNLIRSLVDRAHSGSFSTTQSNVLALWAMANYVDQLEEDDLALKVSASLGERHILDAALSSRTQPPAEASAPLSDLGQKSQLTLAAEGSGQAWSTVRLAFAPKEANLESELGGGLIVSRSYSVVRPAASDPGLTTFKRGQVVKVDVLLVATDDRADLVLEDKVPAGFEPVNFNLKSEDQTLTPILDSASDDEGSYRYGHWYSYQQIWPDRVAVFAERLPAGVYSFSYLVRPATPGLYRLPGPMAQAMYEPETFGRGAGHVITVEP
jgi:uncharacterized protein YfaS (alpha-2-macroglobulin family)